ncbi:unnamed protein product, partial [Mesorhabditis belari]|uniref:Uncharacterized protein n=1 Tax=Mesorhabditis belari TaxID=2138241 RepID=A0AAF3FC28_9BILA
MVINRVRHPQTCTFLRFLSAAPQPSSSGAKPSFSLFVKPKVATPHFEVSRLLTTNLAELYYKRKEPDYTQESFLRGAMEAASLCAEYITSNNWDGLSHLCTKDLVERIRDRCSEADLSQFKVTEGDVLCSFLHSALFSGKKIYQFNPGTVHGYFTAVVFFRTSQSLPYDLTPKEYLNKHIEDLLVCNITLTRTISPLGFWKITTLNYFTPS